jgi:hypothetical protein
MKKAANGRSSIYKDADAWHGWVSFGEDATGRRRRKHVRAQTKAAVAEKVARLERQRDAGYVVVATSSSGLAAAGCPDPRSCLGVGRNRRRVTPLSLPSDHGPVSSGPVLRNVTPDPKWRPW